MSENIVGDTQAMAEEQSSFLQQHGTKLLALLFWTVLVGGYYLYANANNLTLADSLQLIVDFLTASLLGPVFYIVIYALRPLIFFPATVLTLLGGFLFGPIGILWTIIGSNASALVAYTVGRYFGTGVLEGEEETNVIQKYTLRMRQNSFETVLIMRLLFLPYDLVNYAAGFLKIKWQPFILATAIGSIPGTISFVLLAGSFGTLDELVAGDFQVNPLTLIFSVALILVSIGLSRFIKRREASEN
ncbi:MAG: TVP38/TMEM64 family protein [Ardenticatenaceae bacterium]|nr:TVP38/TMEM64 family protein [Ardenticatenaceae bacterium]MCB8949393.1 TVP38/TMEM64 family protein [Ardenticatenaceae bacterium]